MFNIENTKWIMLKFCWLKQDPISLPCITFHLLDLEEIITFYGYNSTKWVCTLRDNLQRDRELYIIEYPIPEQPPWSRILEHDF